MTDRDRGLLILKAFHGNSSLRFKMNFDLFLTTMWPDVKKREIYIAGIGLQANSADMSDSRIESAMRSMAYQSQGRVPASWGDFTKYLQNEAVKINWLDAGVYTFTESAKDIAGGAQALGNQLIFTGKILNFILPAILLIVVLFYVNKSSDGALVKTLGGLRK